MVRVFVVAAVLFVALVANLTYLQVIAAGSLEKKPQNHQAIAQELRVKRGQILAYDGTVIAGVIARSGYYYRTYPHGALAPHIVGYSSVRYGRSGIEASMNDYLVGEAGSLGARSWVDRLLGRRVRGATVRLTIVPSVQRAAQDALAGRRGAIVVLDPSSGALIASASSPTYSPARLEQDWPRLRKDSSAPLLDRADQSLYPPGSSFKVVTAAAALESGKATPTTTYQDTGTYVVYGGRVTNYHGEIFGANTLTQALTFSINTTFAKLGDQLGKAGLVDSMKRFGFWRVPPLELPGGQVRASGRYHGGTLLDPSAPMDPLQVAWAAVGQEQVLATPLQMAIVAAAVANGGRAMKPYVVQEVVSPTGEVIRQGKPEPWTDAVQAATVAQLSEMMQQVVNAGTGTAAALAGIQVAGKTGTAETGATNQAWFIAFAPADAPRVAVAVSIEDTPATGGEVAAPLAAAVMRAALAAGGLP